MPLPKIPSFTRLLPAAALAGFCLVAPAQAATVTVRDLAVGGSADAFAITIPSIELVDADLDEAAVRALFAGDLAATFERLAGLDATAIRIPEMRLTMRLGAAGAGEDSVTVYRDFELRNVVDGVAASLSLAGAQSTGEAGIVVSMGPISSGRLDIGGVLAFYGLVGGGPQTGMRPIYENFAMQGMTVTAPGVTCEIGAVRMAGFFARPLQSSFADILPLLTEIETQQTAGGTVDPALVTRVVAFYIDMFTAFRSSPGAFDGFTCSGSNPEGQPLRITSGPMAMGGFEPGVYPAVEARDFRMDVEGQGWLEAGRMTFKAMDFTAAIAALQAADTLDEAWFAANWRKLLPAFDGFAIADFGLDIPDPEAPGKRIAARVGAFDVTLADYVNGIPASIRLHGADIQAALPADAAALAGLGYDRLDLDYDIAVHWDEGAETIVIDRFAVADTSLGSVSLSGTLGNATAALFADDPDAVASASAALTFKQLEIEVADAGVTDLVVALAAREQNQKPVIFRAMLSGLAQALPIATLGPSEEATALGEALRGFIEGKPNLRLTLTATDPAGIGLAEFEAAQQNPALLAGKLSIVAEASGEPRQPEPAAPSAPPPAAAPPPAPEPGEDKLTPRDTGPRGDKAA